MRLNWRRFGCIFSLFLLLWGVWQPVLFAKQTNNEQLILHIISRTSFGVTPQQIETVKARGIENYLQAQLDPQKIEETATLNQRLAQVEILNRSSFELFETFQQYTNQLNGNKAANLSVAEKEKIQLKRNQYRAEVIRQTRQAHLARAIASKRQLQELMTDFWLNHFNVFAPRKIVSFWLADYVSDIRKLALGNFADLLSLTAHHPAMLIYLDNDLNSKPKNSRNNPNVQGLNENYARELMELHTLGVDGGYTQQDVIALAKILTGWGVDRTGNLGDENNFRFYRQRHDFSDKQFLGTTIAGSGQPEGEQALNMLANHPATARLISYKLAQYFVADKPPETLVKSLTRSFIDSQGNIKTVLNTLFHAPEFNDPQYYGAKFKTPLQYIISVLRISNLTNPNLTKIDGMLNRLSMPLFGCQSPNGYPNTEEAWLNSNSLLERVGFSVNIKREFFGKQKPTDADTLIKILESRLTAKTKKTISDSPQDLRTALILGSPEMMYR